MSLPEDYYVAMAAIEADRKKPRPATKGGYPAPSLLVEAVKSGFGFHAQSAIKADYVQRLKLQGKAAKTKALDYFVKKARGTSDEARREAFEQIANYISLDSELHR